MRSALPSCLVLALVAAPAWAQRPAGPEFQVNTYTTGTQYSGKVAVDAAGKFVVVWQGSDNDIGDIFARRFDAAGVPIGDPFRVGTEYAGWQTQPAVASAPSGAFVVVWRGFGYSVSAVKGQRYDALGSPVGAEFFVNTFTPGVQERPSVAVDGSGNFVVVWASYLQDGSEGGVFGQRFDAAGTRLGAEFRANSYTTGHQDHPRVAADADGDFVVVWDSYGGQDGDGIGVFGQRFSSSGSPRGGEFLVNITTTFTQRFPAVASDAAGRFVVAWSGPNGATYGIGILARRFDASGLPIGGEFQVSEYTTGYQDSAAIAADPAGNFVVSWSGGYHQDGDGRGVFARPYDASGNPLAPEFQVNTFTTGFQGGPSVAAGRHGDLVVVWESYPQEAPGSTGVFGQRYSDLIFGDGFEP
jgi:hypothetical protein